MTDPLNPIHWMTVQEVAEALRISKMTVYRLVHNGTLPAIQIGRSFRVNKRNVVHLVHKSSTGKA